MTNDLTWFCCTRAGSCASALSATGRKSSHSSSPASSMVKPVSGPTPRSWRVENAEFTCIAMSRSNESSSGATFSPFLMLLRMLCSILHPLSILVGEGLALVGLRRGLLGRVGRTRGVAGASVVLVALGLQLALVDRPATRALVVLAARGLELLLALGLRGLLLLVGERRDGALGGLPRRADLGRLRLALLLGGDRLIGLRGLQTRVLRGLLLRVLRIALL